MKRLGVPALANPLFFLAVFLFFWGNYASSQETPRAAPNLQPDPVAAANQAQAPPVDQPAVISQYTLTIAKAGNGQGKVAINPTGTLFKKGTPVSLHAIPEANSAFEGWSGSCSGLSRTCSVTMTTDRAVTASFSLKTYTIYVRSPVNGVIHPFGSVKAYHGEKRRFQIIPLPGYSISEVLVDKVSVGSVKSYTFNSVTDDHVIEAIFVKQ